MLSVRCKVWVEQDGQAVFGDGRVQLLEGIRDAGSLTAAAKRLGMPYRTAWKHLSLMERAYGRRLVERTTGGATGGGCRLTPAGRKLLDGYLTFRKRLDAVVTRHARRFVDAP
ncbi:MAG: LysR family transcriptional regulator [Planctomycetes bacterium]|nr:LysR family transcriptional regulator [Planctomycetota bacterium]